MNKSSLILSLLLVLCLERDAETSALQIMSSHALQPSSSFSATCMGDDRSQKDGGFRNQPASTQRHRQNHSSPHETARRRLLLVHVALFGANLKVPLAGATTASPQQPNNIFADKKFSTEEATKRFLAAREDLKYLLENYSEITRNGNGDSVRNYLGTQGVNSNLYGIQKVLKVLTESADDIVEYTEAMEEFNAYYYQAEGAAYQSLFVEYSSAKGSPEMYLATAKQDIIQMQKCMDRLAQHLNL